MGISHVVNDLEAIVFPWPQTMVRNGYIGGVVDQYEPITVSS